MSAIKKLQEHLANCSSCQGGAICQQGKVMMMAAMDAGSTATARASFATSEGLPVSAGQGDEFEIQWMPPGHQKIKCFVNDGRRDMDFTVKPQHAMAFNAMLQYLRAKAAAGNGDEPFIDFNHEDGAASGRPTEMFWGGEDPKKGGIRLRGKWTGSGKSAVVNRDFTRFSPQWDFDPDTDEPTGIGVNLGGLVNRAAFRTMQSVAKDAASKQKGQTMDRKEFQEWLTEGLKPLVDRIGALEAKATDANKGSAATAQAAAAVDEKKIVELIGTALKPVTTAMEAINETNKKTAEARAKDAVQAHVARGAIAPEDTETIKFYTDNFIKDAAATEKAMAKLPGKSLTRVVRGQAETRTATAGGEPEQVFMAKAKEFGEKNKITGGAAEVMSAFARSAEGKELYEQFRGKIIGRAD